MENHIINIAIVEDDLQFRENLISYFSMLPAFNVLFTAGSVEIGLSELNDNLGIDILVLDIGLPGISGIEGISYFKKIKSDLDIIMLTSYEEEEKILKALCSGASSYISKKTPVGEIAKAIEIVYNGGSFMSPSIAREIVKFFAKGQKQKQDFFLTPRQNEIMEMVIDGNTYGSIAKSLHLSIETIKSHIKNIYKILHVNNKAEAIVKYLNG